MSQSYRVSGPHIVHETIDNEVVIVNMETGAYYSLRGSGHAIWALVVDGRTVQTIGESFLDGSNCGKTTDAKAIAAHVNDFIETLTSENLITTTEDAACKSGSPSIDKIPFLVPALEKFTDMEDFLLVDPIHEVGEQGWPHRPEAPPQ